jgi:outer membrane receptor protein involved in Fe transport
MTVTVPAFAQATFQKFEIPAQDLGEALRTFGRAANQQVSFDGAATRGKRSHGVHGVLSADEALATLLQGTGLSFRRAPSGVLIVTQREAPGESASANATDVLAQQEARIVVTGSRLRGGPITAPVTRLDRRYIERSGRTSIADVINSSPMAFGGGLNRALVSARGVNASAAGASSPNIHGLGPESTLSLVDGHRLALNFLYGGADISLIPLPAVERIDIVPDGSSAIYGSDAVAGVVNIVLRKDMEGSEISGSYSAATRGGADQWNADYLGGHQWASGGITVAYEHAFNAALYSDERSFSKTAARPTTLLPHDVRNSLYFNLHQDVSEALSFYAIGLGAIRTNRNAIGIGALASLGFNNEHQYSLVGGARAKLGGDFVANASLSYARDRLRERFPLFVAATGAQLSNDSLVARDSTLTAEFDIAGSLIDFGAGPVRLDVGSGYRHELFGETVASGAQPPIDARRSVKYGFAEIGVPIVAHNSDRIGLTALDLTGAFRAEDYSSFGSTQNYKLGVRYAPLSKLALKASYGTSFRAPLMVDAFGPINTLNFFATSFPGLTAPAGSQVLVEFGPNRALKPEKAKTLNVGLEYEPDFVPGLRLSLNYFRINYRDRISAPLSSFLAAFQNPASAPFIVMNPTRAMIDALVAETQLFQSAGPTFDPTRVVAIVLDRRQNLARQRAHGVDLAADWTTKLGGGTLDLTAAATWLDLKRQATASASTTQLSGTIFNPPNARFRLGSSWSKSGFTISSFVNHVSSEIDVFQIPNRHIGAWTTVDAQIAYAFQQKNGPLNGFRVSLSAQNLFDRKPPFVAATSTQFPGIGFDSTNHNALGRYITISAAKQF